MKIYEVPNGAYVIKNGDVIPIEDLRVDWENLTIEERSGWHTTTCERLKVNADEVIDQVIESLADAGYEEMDVMLRERISDEDVARLQVVLDKLFDNSAADVYYQAEEIEVNYD